MGGNDYRLLVQEGQRVLQAAERAYAYSEKDDRRQARHAKKEDRKHREIARHGLKRSWT